MLKCSSLFVSRSTAKWGSHGTSSRGSATMALPTLFESLAPSVAAQRSGIALELKSFYDRCVALVESPSRRMLAPLLSLEASILRAVQGPPPEPMPGFIIGNSRKLGAFGTKLFRNVYPDFASSEKKWIWRLVAANAATFLLWQTAGHSTDGRQWMWENMMVSIKTIRAGRLWVFGTSPFSSNDLFTLSLNATSLLTFGTPVLAALGAAPFLGLYFGTAFLTSLFHMEYFAFPTQSQTPTPNQLWYSDHASFHASTGAASALAGFYGGAWFKQPISVAGTFRVPSWAAVAAFSILQLYHADNTRQAWQGNIAGLVAGAAIGFVFRGRIRV